MGRFGIPEDQPIENKLISRALESAQAKIEGFNFDARKYTLEYDNVMNRQRKSVYERRRAMLFSDREKIQEYLDALIGEDVELRARIEDRKNTVGEEPFFEAVRRIMLYVNDILWVEHIETMEYTRSSVNLRAYGQREPLVEYKKEGLRLYKEMEISFKAQVLNFIETMNMEVQNVQKENVREAGVVSSKEIIGAFDGMEAAPEAVSQPAVEQHNLPAQAGESKVGRNDLCPCGSGKKWKKCGAENTEEHQKLMVGKK